MGRLHERVCDRPTGVPTNAPRAKRLESSTAALKQTFVRRRSDNRPDSWHAKNHLSQSCNDVLMVSEHRVDTEQPLHNCHSHSRGLDGDSIHFDVDG